MAAAPLRVGPRRREFRSTEAWGPFPRGGRERVALPGLGWSCRRGSVPFARFHPPPPRWTRLRISRSFLTVSHLVRGGEVMLAWEGIRAGGGGRGAGLGLAGPRSLPTGAPSVLGGAGADRSGWGPLAQSSSTSRLARPPGLSRPHFLPRLAWRTRSWWWCLEPRVSGTRVRGFTGAGFPGVASPEVQPAQPRRARAPPSAGRRPRGLEGGVRWLAPQAQCRALGQDLSTDSH